MNERLDGRTIKIAVLASRAGPMRYGVAIRQGDQEVILHVADKSGTSSRAAARNAAQEIFEAMHDRTEWTVGLHLDPPLELSFDVGESDEDLPSIDDVRGILKIPPEESYLCSQVGGHRLGVNGRCIWCDAELGESR